MTRRCAASSNWTRLTRNVPTLDVDITDRAACRAVFDRIMERFEESGLVLCRVGNAPKFSVPFRTSAPFKKFEATLIAPTGRAMKFEFLGDGQQFIVAGRHPDTGADYRWWPTGQDLTTVPRAALPDIDEGVARALLEDLAALLVNEHGFTRPEKPKERAVFKPRGDTTAPRAAPGCKGQRGRSHSRRPGRHTRLRSQQTPVLGRPSLRRAGSDQGAGGRGIAGRSRRPARGRPAYRAGIF
jgi:hypothetical protein